MTEERLGLWRTLHRAQRTHVVSHASDLFAVTRCGIVVRVDGAREGTILARPGGGVWCRCAKCASAQSGDGRGVPLTAHFVRNSGLIEDATSGQRSEGR